MKALILNSGTGSRMGDIKTCKCLVEIIKEKTIADEQIRRLIKCGIRDICITTGPYADKLEDYLRNRYISINFEFVHNPLYDKTNYIYSIFLAHEYFDKNKCNPDGIILMHGDLVFETELLRESIAYPHSCMTIDTTKPLPEKDFKAIIKNDKIKGVGVNFFNPAPFESIVYAQPLYKLTWRDWQIWLDEICRFCQEDNTSVYAEDALNTVSEKMNLFPLDARGRTCFEIDNANDLAYARDVYKQCS